MIKKQTKIVATVSDLRCDQKFIKKLYENGVDVVRLNTAHQSQNDTLKVVKNVRKVSERIALLLDTKGPEIRTTMVDKKIILKKGDVVKFKGGTTRNVSTSEDIFVNYKNFVKDVPVGAMILIDDGEIGLKVIKKTLGYLSCKVLNDGQIKANKSVNVPDVSINLPSLSKKDRDYINFAIENKLDFIAHSFVRNAKDVLAIQRILDKAKSKIKIIAKIENREGVDNIDEILDYAHGIMIARGDLGIEIPAEEVPFVQKKLIEKCILRQKPVITATQMLHTMIKNPRPTRAEVSDIANAVLDGTDALMLSGETAYGDYPLEAVKVMTKIVKRVEEIKKPFTYLPVVENERKIVNYLAKSAIEATQELDIKEIIVSTKTEYIAEVLASYRGNIPVFAKCFDKRIVRKLALTYGIHAHYVRPEKHRSELIKKVIVNAVRKKLLNKNDLIIFLTGGGNKNVTANVLEICSVAKYL